MSLQFLKRYSLTGKTQRPIKIYVEDTLASCIVKEIAKKLEMASYVEILTYGSIENAFTLAASFGLYSDKSKHILIVLDGDRYITKKEKEDQIKKKLSGTEADILEKRSKALSMIVQFHLQDGNAPERQLYIMLREFEPKSSELYKAANEISAVDDSHQWLSKICEQTGFSEAEIVHEIYHAAASSEDMIEYTKEIEQWLLSTQKGL